MHVQIVVFVSKIIYIYKTICLDYSLAAVLMSPPSDKVRELQVSDKNGRKIGCTLPETKRKRTREMDGWFIQLFPLAAYWRIFKGELFVSGRVKP